MMSSSLYHKVSPKCPLARTRPCKRYVERPLGFLLVGFLYLVSHTALTFFSNYQSPLQSLLL